MDFGCGSLGAQLRNEMECVLTFYRPERSEVIRSLVDGCSVFAVIRGCFFAGAEDIWCFCLESTCVWRATDVRPCVLMCSKRQSARERS